MFTSLFSRLSSLVPLSSTLTPFDTYSPLSTPVHSHLPSPQLATLICHTRLPSSPPSSGIYLNLAIFSDLVPQHGLGLCRSAGAQLFGVANQDHLLTFISCFLPRLILLGLLLVHLLLFLLLLVLTLLLTSPPLTRCY